MSGLTILRADGKESVSSRFPHYCFIKKVRVSAFSHWYDLSGYTYSNHVIVAFKQVQSVVNVGRFSKGAHVLWLTIGAPPPPNNATLSIFSYAEADAYIFDLATSSEGKSGLQVFNEQGICTFNSSQRFMRIVDVIQDIAPITSNPWNTTTSPKKTYHFPNNTNLAIIPLKEGYHIIYSDREQMYGKTWQQVNNGSIDVTMEYFEEVGPSGSGSIMHLPFTAIVIDLTHIESL